jgi:hypothetical protein
VYIAAFKSPEDRKNFDDFPAEAIKKFKVSEI